MSNDQIERLLICDPISYRRVTGVSNPTTCCLSHIVLDAEHKPDGNEQT